MAFAVPTRALNSRKVMVSTKDLTLDARFTMASELRQQAASRQSQGREKALTQKRGLASAEKLTKQQVCFRFPKQLAGATFEMPEILNTSICTVVAVSCLKVRSPCCQFRHASCQDVQ